MSDAGDFAADTTLEIKDIKPIVPSELYKIIKGHGSKSLLKGPWVLPKMAPKL